MKNKKQEYKNVTIHLENILDTEPQLSSISKMSIIASELYTKFNYWIFCGFYILSNNFLEIGPYHGRILPCSRISIGNGVCGTSAKKKKTIIINDVSKIQYYISCDSETNSEI